MMYRPARYWSETSDELIRPRRSRDLDGSGSGELLGRDEGAAFEAELEERDVLQGRWDHIGRGVDERADHASVRDHQDRPFPGRRGSPIYRKR